MCMNGCNCRQLASLVTLPFHFAFVVLEKQCEAGFVELSKSLERSTGCGLLRNSSDLKLRTWWVVFIGAVFERPTPAPWIILLFRLIHADVINFLNPSSLCPNCLPIPLLGVLGTDFDVEKPLIHWASMNRHAWQWKITLRWFGLCVSYNYSQYYCIAGWCTTELFAPVADL